MKAVLILTVVSIALCVVDAQKKPPKGPKAPKPPKDEKITLSPLTEVDWSATEKTEWTKTIEGNQEKGNNALNLGGVNPKKTPGKPKGPKGGRKPPRAGKPGKAAKPANADAGATLSPLTAQVWRATERSSWTEEFEGDLEKGNSALNFGGGNKKVPGKGKKPKGGGLKPKGGARKPSVTTLGIKNKPCGSVTDCKANEKCTDNPAGDTVCLCSNGFARYLDGACKAMQCYC